MTVPRPENLEQLENGWIDTTIARADARRDYDAAFEALVVAETNELVARLRFEAARERLARCA